MSQMDPLQSLLGCLCYGVCTEEDFVFLNKFIIINHSVEENNVLLNVKHWVDNPDFACPLICYTNAVHGADNIAASKAFAAVTGQVFHYYYATDLTGHGRNKHTLHNASVEAAWSAKVKNTGD